MKDKTILLVEDETHIIYLLVHKLEQGGVNMLTANDGEHGYRLACEHLPDMVISDFQMPMMSGYELSVKLRTNHKTANIPVLMLTAQGHKLSNEELAQTNVRDLMSKPFSTRELIERVKELLVDAAHGRDETASDDADRMAVA